MLTQKKVGTTSAQHFDIDSKVVVAMLIKGPVLAMFVVGVFDLVSWCTGDGACMLISVMK